MPGTKDLHKAQRTAKKRLKKNKQQGKELWDGFQRVRSAEVASPALASSKSKRPK